MKVWCNDIASSEEYAARKETRTCMEWRRGLREEEGSEGGRYGGEGREGRKEGRRRERERENTGGRGSPSSMGNHQSRRHTRFDTPSHSCCHTMCPPFRRRAGSYPRSLCLPDSLGYPSINHARIESKHVLDAHPPCLHVLCRLMSALPSILHHPMCTGRVSKAKEMA